jgi:O-antigen/teichoic acid export membrane protein
VPLLFVAAALWQIALIAHKPLEMMDRTRLLALMLLAATSATVIGSVLLTPVLGELGAALAFAAGAGLYVSAVLARSRLATAQLPDPIEKVSS